MVSLEGGCWKSALSSNSPAAYPTARAVLRGRGGSDVALLPEHYESEIIILCVRWYLRYALSYRDLEEMMNERGLAVDHTTIYRWVQAYAPELEKRIRPHMRLTNDSYRAW